ncbi:MAG TPA: AAA family ATPase [Gaiellaceae bacterium]
MAPKILSRAREQDAAARFLDSIAEGPAALVLAGPAGIGKTTLWRHAVDDAERRGYRVLITRPTETEARLSYVGLTDLISARFDDARSALPLTQESALAAALLRGSAEDAADPRIVSTAFTAVLEALARDAPVVLAVDDVQWLDAASKRTLEFAVRRLTGRIGVLASERTDATDADTLGLRRALGDERLELLLVGPLSIAALHHLVRERLGTSLPRPLLAQVAETSGGNPFFALELARAAAAWAGPGPLPLPPSLRELTAARIGRLSPEAREVGLVAAAATRPTISLVERVVRDAATALEEAEAAGVLEDEHGLLRFSHPLVAAALAGGESPAERRRLHGRLAEIVEEPEERARHLALSTVDADEPVAREIETAADGVALRGAQDAAAELYSAAARLTPRDRNTELARRLLGEAAALFAVGDAEHAAALALRAGEIGDPSIRARALLLHAEIMWAGGATDAVIAQLDAALAAAHDDPELEARIRARLVAFGMSTAPKRAVVEARRAERLLRTENERGLLAYVLFNRFFTEALLARGAKRELLARALELEARAGSQTTMSSIPHIWFHCVDEHDAARERHRLEERWYAERGEELWRAERLAHRALVELRAGEVALAEELIEESWIRIEPFEESGVWVAPHLVRAIIDAHCGRFERARDDLAAQISSMEESANLWWSTLSLSALAFVEFAAGDHDAADDALTRMRTATDAIGLKDVLPDRSEPNEIESCLTRGELGRAQAALGRLEWRGRVLARPWITAALPRSRALVLAASGDLTAALAAVDEAPVVPELPFEVARTALVRGRLHRRANHKLLAADALREAVAAFDRLGALPWLAQAQDELERVGLRHRPPDELTAGERKVAELAASGLTNRQVAEAAFMSPKTVEANLARVYRKLGIRSRAELGARIVGERQEGDAQT